MLSLDCALHPERCGPNAFTNAQVLGAVVLNQPHANSMGEQTHGTQNRWQMSAVPHPSRQVVQTGAQSAALPAGSLAPGS